jgi:branched-chain amino acid transport system permease protein
LFVQQFVNGLTIGGCYALVSVGFTMVFGVLELTNFAHNSVYLFGAYLAAVLIFNGAGIFLAVAGTLLCCGLMGVVIDRCALKPMRSHGSARAGYLICTIGISTFLQDLVRFIFGPQAQPFPDIFVKGSIRLGANAAISYVQLFSLALTVVLMALLTLLVYKTRMGAAMRAVAQNERAARLMGINVDTVVTFTFFLGSVLAAVSGIMTGIYYRSLDLSMGFFVAMKMFAAAVLGGIGVLPGAVIGGFMIGVLETLFAGYVDSSFKDAISFIILIGVLLIRPNGLMGRKSAQMV